MRRPHSILPYVLAALGGGLLVTLLGLPTREPAPKVAETATQLAQAALPAPAMAALPAEVNGQALPSLAPMLERVTPAVVNIYTAQRVQVRNPLADFFGFGGFPSMPQERVEQSLGSGVIIDAERGLVLTNHHVIEGADEVSVTLSDGRTVQAEFEGSDPDTDVAVIRIPAENLSAIPLADSAQLRVGDFVVAVGNPFGLGQTVTSGIVSAVGRSGLQGLGYQNFIQTDASINPGNSGGALVNLRGELVGINTASFNPRGSAAGNIGLGFAIPANLAREVMRQLMAYGEVRRGTLGLDSEDISARLAEHLGLASRRGALIARIYRGSPAEAAGLQPGDVILAANDQRVDNAQALRNIEGLLPVGEAVQLEILRDGRTLAITATPKVRAKEIAGDELDPRLAGATLAELPERYRQQGMRGVVVTQVDPRGRAAASGLRAGDRVFGANRQRIADLPALRAQLADRPEQLVLHLQRGNRQGDLRLQ
ncbi:MAG TPA: DegQ family serine endoprotease [Arenimonas sp.]|nr:DegQ family serine endoprotease [Arenimonas sp.]